MTRIIAVLGMIALCACSGPGLEPTRAAAETALARGQLAEVDRYVAQGLALTAAEPQSVWAWRFKLLGVDAQISRLALADAEKALAAPVPAAADFAVARGRQRFLLARVQVLQGKLKEAAVTLDQAAMAAPFDRELQFDIEILNSQLRFRTGQWSAAESGLRTLIQQAEAGGFHHHQALALNNLGMGLVVRNRFDEALPWFERVVASRSLDGTTIYGQALNNAGICYARLGQFERAVASQQKAIELHKGGRQLDYSQALGELGSTYLLQGDVSRGAEYLKKAFDVAAGAGLANDAAIWATNLAAASVALGQWDDAARFNGEAARFQAAGKSTRPPYSTVTEAQVAAGRGDDGNAERLFRVALDAPDATPGVKWLAYDGLAQLAANARRPADAARHFEAALQTVEQTRSALLKADYRISFTSRLIQFYDRYVELLLAEGQVERALEVADSSRGRVLAERQNVAAAPARTAAAALKLLARQTRTTLLFYWLGPTQSWVWTVTGDGITATPLAPRTGLETLVASHQSAIQNALADPLATVNSAGDALYQQLIQPVAPSVAPGSSVVIVPDGALHRLNFETLPVPGTPRHYWIEDVTVQIAPTLAMLRPASRRSPAGTVNRQGEGGPSLLLVGNPTPRAPEFPALSYAAAEMGSVTKHFASGGITSLDGERASPAAFLSAQPERFSVIHFTSHAVANLENPLDSAVILSGPDQAFKLYARDVAALPLTAELVTVSACRSAGERTYAGEGLVGFAWAFLRAGSHRVVAGLWDVDDRSTAALMDQVYARMAGGATPAVALRDAKLALIKNGFPKPYYWAPFQLFTVTL
jgi:CHAT domain-containing protein/tetratricopeptide (TPR) repeat protein